MSGLLSGSSEETGPPPARVTAPPTVREQTDRGPVDVYGASVYSPGQRIYKELRQEESLMAFLACQGEPDRVEVLPGAPGEPPRIVLEYRRRGLGQTGTVAIEATDAGFYAAAPIDPEGRLGAKAPPPTPEHEARPAPKPKPAPTTAGEKPAPPEDEGEERVAIPEPTRDQLDDCPIEYWRVDCRDLCVPGADWEWCEYVD